MAHFGVLQKFNFLWILHEVLWRYFWESLWCCSIYVVLQTGSPFPECKAARAWSWWLAFIQAQGSEWGEIYLRFIYAFKAQTETTLSLFCFLDRAFSIMKTKINQQNAQINSGLLYYWSITPTCFGPSVEAIIREFKILESYKAIVLIC